MFRFLKSRAFLTIVGLVILALLIWFTGDLILVPLQSERARFFAIVALIASFGVWKLIEKIRATQASNKLAAAVVKQSQGESKSSADVAQLRERFEEAIATLKQKKRGGHSLYELPWYVIIGAPGSGKTTALVNSGLHFPLEQRSGKGALRGVGGTRNCDWWFTEEAVLLDTAGRYTTQDSDATADSAGWAEFLALLRKYRKRRPVNGVILAISAGDLLVQGQAGREAHVAAARRRLNELNKELHINIPVYVLVTKCDLVAGFTEYFDDLTQETRSRVWGVTFPQDLTDKGTATAAFPAEFDALVQRLNERVFARLEDDHDVRRRAKLFGFPQQMGALRESLVEFVTDVFESTRFDQKVLLRGVYFTSGTQEGTPIDRLLGAMGRRFSTEAEAVTPGGSRGKAYFIESLLKDVMLAESGLAGVNRRMELQKGAVQLGAYAAMVLGAALGVLALTLSYKQNKQYLDDVAARVASLMEIKQQMPVAASSRGVVARLDAVRAVVDEAERHAAGTTWLMRWGLYQGSVGEEAEHAYARELGVLLLPQVVVGLEEHLRARDQAPEWLYDYLKGYLMLGHRGPFDAAFLGRLSWSESEAGETASKHFRSLLGFRNQLRKVEPCDPAELVRPCIDDRLVKQARNSIAQVSLERLMFRRVESAYADDEARKLRLDIESGVGAEAVLRFKNGSFSEPVSSIYTAKVFEEITKDQAIAKLVSSFESETWVWGETGAPGVDGAALAVKFLDVYETAYIKKWDDILAEFDVVPMPTVPKMIATLSSLAGPNSPLRGFFVVVDKNTHLVKPPETGQPGIGDRMSQAAAGAVRRVTGSPAKSAPKPGERITQHFDAIHKLVAGDPASAMITRLLGGLLQLQKQVGAVGSGLGDVAPVEVLTRPELGGSVQSLRQEAQGLPNPLPGVVDRIVTGVEVATIRGASTVLENQYRQEVLLPCQDRAGDRYPLAPQATQEVTLLDFGSLFGFGGFFDRFFKERLQGLIDDSTRPWKAKGGDSGATVVSNSMIRQFQAAREIRDAFFRPGSMKPEVQFTVQPSDLGENLDRFLFMVDGQKFEYRSGPELSQKMTWPGPAAGEATARFEDRSPVPPSIVSKGPWALFKLLERQPHVQVQPENETDFLVTFQEGGRWAKVRIVAESQVNPFSRRGVLRFNCGK